MTPEDHADLARLREMGAEDKTRDAERYQIVTRLHGRVENGVIGRAMNPDAKTKQSASASVSNYLARKRKAAAQ